MTAYPINDERNHPHFGGCDGFGPNGNCSECAGLIQREDGSVVKIYGGELVKRAPLRTRLVRAWWALRGGVIGAKDEMQW